MCKTLIIYSSTDGHTEKICAQIARMIESHSTSGIRLASDVVQVIAIELAHSLNLSTFDNIVIGASIRYGKHAKNVSEFIIQNQAVLDSKFSAFFSVNLVARKAKRSSPATNPYVVKFFKSIHWQPNLIAVFAGKIDYSKYRFLDRIMIQCIMKLTNGPTSMNTVKEFTNWLAVDRFAMKLADVKRR